MTDDSFYCAECSGVMMPVDGTCPVCGSEPMPMLRSDLAKNAERVPLKYVDGEWVQNPQL